MWQSIWIVLGVFGFAYFIINKVVENIEEKFENKLEEVVIPKLADYVTDNMRSFFDYIIDYKLNQVNLKCTCSCQCTKEI